MPLLLVSFATARRQSSHTGAISMPWNSYGTHCGGKGFWQDTCTTEVPHLLRCFAEGEKGSEVWRREGGHCYIPHRGICQDAEQFCRPGTECRAIEGMPGASIKFCTLPGEMPSQVLSTSRASKQLALAGKRGWIYPLQLVQQGQYQMKLERTFFLNSEALEHFGALKMGAESCRACWALAWQYHLDTDLRGKYERCTFDSDVLNAVCVWFHNAGWQPKDLGNIAELFGAHNPGHMSMATSICQWSPDSEKVCPTYMRTAEDLWNQLSLARCHKPWRVDVFQFSPTGSHLCHQNPFSSELLEAFPALFPAKSSASAGDPLFSPPADLFQVLFPSGTSDDSDEGDPEDSEMHDGS